MRSKKSETGATELVKKTKTGAVVKAFDPVARLKRTIRVHFTKLGFTRAQDGTLILPGTEKEIVRQLHQGQREERLLSGASSTAAALRRVTRCFANGAEIDPHKISLRLVRVFSDTIEADIFRIAALTWSVPVSPGFGRRLRYLVWDEYHDKVAGIIALGDPVFNLSVRDDLIGWSVRKLALQGDCSETAIKVRLIRKSTRCPNLPRTRPAAGDRHEAAFLNCHRQSFSRRLASGIRPH